MPYVKRFKYLKSSKYQKPYSSKANEKSKNKFFKKKTFNLFRKEKSVEQFNPTIDKFQNLESIEMFQ